VIVDRRSFRACGVHSCEGTPGIPAPNHPGRPAPCDRREYARRWDAWQYHLAHLGADYPYLDEPPMTLPVQR